MDGCPTTESGLTARYGKAPLRRGFSISTGSMLCAARMMALLARKLGSRVEVADVGESVTVS
jgi:hypothetical protein